MTTYTERPSWFYKPVQIENLEAIQKELLTVLYKRVPNFDTAPPMFYYTSREEVESDAPLYTAYIESLGLLDKWIVSPIITTNYHQQFPIHIDSSDWYTKSYGLNIPIINCEDTYTVWYDAEIDYGATVVKQRNEEEASRISVARLVKPNTTSTEIARWHTKDPAWINVSIPHAPVSNHNKPRALISARFSPELHDILYK